MEINSLKDKFFNTLYENVMDCLDPELMDTVHRFGFVALVHKVGSSLRFDKVFSKDDCNFLVIDDYINRHPEWKYSLVSFDTDVVLRGLLAHKTFNRNE